MSLLNAILIVNTCITAIHAQNIECHAASQCIGQDISTAFTVENRGYKSAFGPTTTISTADTIWCFGAFSCNSISSATSTNNIACLGSNACVNVNPLTANSWTCRASHSCTHSTFIGTAIDSNIFCAGFKSCAYSRFSGIQTIEAYGAYTFYNSTIDSLNTLGPLVASFSGYHAGLSAKLTCQSGDTCTINCYGNGCYMLYVHCPGSCTINTPTGDSIAPINYATDLQTNLEYEPQQNTVDNDNACNEAGAVTYDDNNEHFNGTDLHINSAVSLCCRGEHSCGHITAASRVVSTIVCSGEGSCQGSQYTTQGGDIYCEAKDSCRTSLLSTTADVYCLGRRGCGSAPATIQNALHVYCMGFWACNSASISSKGLGHTHYAYFLGSKSGKSGSYHCKTNDHCILYCGARDACLNLALTCEGTCTVYCDEDSMCPDGYTQNIKTPAPTLLPSFTPTAAPSADPSVTPTRTPSNPPTGFPSIKPSIRPSQHPTHNPTSSPHKEGKEVVEDMDTSTTASIINTGHMETKQDDTVMVYAVSGAVSLFLGSVVIVLLVLLCKYRKAEEVKKHLVFADTALGNTDVQGTMNANAPGTMNTGTMSVADGNVGQHATTDGHQTMNTAHDDNDKHDTDETIMCGECGVKLRQDRDRKLSTDGVVICATCKRLERDDVSEEVDQMFDVNITARHRNMTAGGPGDDRMGTPGYTPKGTAGGDPIGLQLSQRHGLNQNDGEDSATLSEVEGGCKDDGGINPIKLTDRGSVMHISDDTVPTAGNYENEEQKEDVMLDSMLCDIVEMQNLDPNKIHQINLNNSVNQVNNNSDTDESDTIYQH
eukprot:392188_1